MKKQNTTTTTRAPYDYKEALKRTTAAAMEAAKKEAPTTPAPVAPIKAARVAAAVRRAMNPTTPAPVAARIMRSLKAVAPASYMKLFTAPAVTTAPTIDEVKSATPINHRAEEAAERRAFFADTTYDLARRVVAAKIKGAIRRGATADKNIYIRHYADMIQTAAQSLSESEAEAAQYTILTPAEMEGDFFTDHHSPFIEACRACGRLEKWIVTRSAKEGTPVDHISERSGESAAHRAIIEREALKDWTRRVIDLIEEQKRMKKLTQTQAENMKHLLNGHPEKIEQPDIIRRHLARKLVKAGLLKVAKDGYMEIVSE